MKDPYSYEEFDSAQNPSQEDTPFSGESSPKRPSESSLRRILDFSKSYELLQREDGSEQFELMRN